MAKTVVIDGVDYVPLSEKKAVEAELQDVMAEFQRLQPGGSPPPGGPAILARWVRLQVVRRLAGLQALAMPNPSTIPQEATHFSLDGDAVAFWKKNDKGAAFTTLSRWWKDQWVVCTGHLPWNELIPLHECRAEQHSDQMVCAPCNLRWDMNDPHPPECPRRKP